MSGKMRALRCPECGSSLLSDGKVVWCSFVGSQGSTPHQKACDYGIATQVKIEDVPQDGIVQVAEGVDFVWRQYREKQRRDHANLIDGSSIDF